MAEKESRATHAFFRWLVPMLDRVFVDSQVQTSVSQKLAAISPQIRWEAGPHQDKVNFFAFSPNFDVKLLPVTEALVFAAPEVPGWIFLPAKPRKRWYSRTVTIRDESKNTIQYTLDDWLYYLVGFKSGEFFDVNLVPRGTAASQAELQRLGEFLVQSELGEKLFLEFVDRVNIVQPEELKHIGNKIEHLYDQLVEQLAKHPRH